MQRRLFTAIVLSALVVMASLWLINRMAGGDSDELSLIAEVGYLRDDRDRDIATISTLPFTPIGTTFSGGYDPAAHWFRIRLTAPQPRQPVVLGIYPTFLDHVTLFGPGDGGVWDQQQTGDTVPMAQRGWQSPDLGFVVHPSAQHDVYYLRIRTDSTAQVFLSARAQPNELVHSSQRMAFHALLFTLMGLSVIVALIQTVFRPTLPSVLLAFSNLSYLFYTVLMLGYAAAAHPAWEIGQIARLADMMYFITTAASIAFHRQFLTRMRPWRTTLFFADALSLTSLLGLVAFLSGQAPLAFQMNSIVVLGSVFGLMALVLTARESGDPPLSVLRLIYSVYALSAAAWMLAILGVTASNQFDRFSLEVHGLLNVTLVLSLVLSRWWSVERRTAQTKARLQDAALRHAASARATELQDKLLNMLVHEVRNHLATIRISVENTRDPADHAATAEVVDTLERTIFDCVRLAWLERGEWRPATGTADLAVVLMEALAETGHDERVDVMIPDDAQPMLAHDGTMLRTALAQLVQEVADRSDPASRIDVSVDRAPDDGAEVWTVSIAATCATVRPISFDPYAPMDSDADGSARRSNLALAVSRGIIELISGKLSLGYRQKRIECILSLPATSTSA